MINGVPQSFGAQYKATRVQFNPRKNTFSADIASAYPSQSEVKSWVRSYTMSDAGLRIEDAFTLNKIIAPNQVNFLTWGNVDLSAPGEVLINVNGEKMKLVYDKQAFSAAKEVIELTDPRLSNVWGKEIYRISLNAKNSSLKGKYVFTIQPVK